MIKSQSAVPNCRNSSISPFLRTTSLAPAAGGCYQSWMPAAVRGRSWTALPRKSRLISGPRAAMRDFGAVVELPETKGSFYELLGIPASGSTDDIKRAYKHLARKYHPDVSPPDRTEEYTQRFIEVKEAYDTLLDPCHRAIYDRNLARSDLHLAFSTAKRRFHEEMEKESWLQKRFHDQLVELSRRSTMKNSEENLSWGARMRRRSAEAPAY
ncbi:chaperone protein dnaJ 20, chloroplastic-like [Dendrobium catenatum]|uniref:Chaperone protein dnaJ 20, chloroplastic n=1 Tax=Dendrobium catenatum TaxID=906689 RepID=A0A2I0X0E0_9ASPA|nr:chaperone protein dnaJ 20, chloroplastic-like [Dendrobium catenatum]PKU81371.1 Chaperone protein dnaJ 20, chloroplastic [Dendrobium catenatum]